MIDRVKPYATNAGFRAVTFAVREGGGYAQVYQRGNEAALISANFIDGEHTAEQCLEFADLLRDAADCARDWTSERCSV
jgi:hypothetical protein